MTKISDLHRRWSKDADYKDAMAPSVGSSISRGF